MTATCSNCSYGRQTGGREGREYLCTIDNPKIVVSWPPLDADDVCGRHPYRPGRVHELAAMAMQGLISYDGWDDCTVKNAYGIARNMLSEAAKECK